MQSFRNILPSSSFFPEFESNGFLNNIRKYVVYQTKSCSIPEGGDMNTHCQDIHSLVSIPYFTSSEVGRTWKTSPYQGTLIIDCFGNTICCCTIHHRNIFWKYIYLKLFILSFQCERPIYYFEDKMKYTYLPHTDFKYRLSKACKKAVCNRSLALDTFKLLPFEEIMAPSSELCIFYYCQISLGYICYV